MGKNNLYEWYKWVNDNNVDINHSYSKGWWDIVEFFHFIGDRFEADNQSVVTTYEITTPPPCTQLELPLVRFAKDGIVIHFKADFGNFQHTWLVSVDSERPITESMVHNLAMNFERAKSQWKHDPFPIDVNYGTIREDSCRFTCSLESERDVYMLLWMLFQPSPLY